jgi:hypothetical protein
MIEVGGPERTALCTDIVHSAFVVAHFGPLLVKKRMRPLSTHG